MGIKGSATIELTNADGSKEIYKHDNMITNAVQDLCMSQRGEMATILKIVNNGDSYAQALFGGLLLFDETLDTDANNYFIPTAKCTGYASQDAYAGLDTCRGSFNASEGGIQPDGSYKFVWDFATSQANGTIKSLALCPNMMGQIGLTSSKISSESKSFLMKRTDVDPFNSYGYMLKENTTIDGFSSQSIYAISVIDDIAYAISVDNTGFRGGGASANLCVKKNGGILKLFRFKLGASSIALTDKVCMANYIDTVNVQLPTEFIDTITYSAYKELIGCFYDRDNNKVIVFPSGRSENLEVNGTLKYCEIDLSNNFATATYTFTNNTAGRINADSYSDVGSTATYPFFVMKDYIICTSYVSDENTNKLYTIKRSDNTQVKEIQHLNGDAFTYDIKNTVTIAPIFSKDNIAVVGVRFSSYDIGNYILVDLSTGKAVDTNISNITQVRPFDIGNCAVFASTGQNLRYSMTFNPFILCTKNNLDSPVTKTASQTMKITYTLSVADTAGSEV